ncbi:MAG: hypothetical protein AAGL68_08450 [Pseudomonadota bacterium]
MAIPHMPMRLARRIERELRDGEKLVVIREWQVDFARQGLGIIISGQQLSAQVEAPAMLEPLAAIERARSTSGMFPIMLSDAGNIIALGDGLAEDDLEAAAREAKILIAKSSDNPAKQAQRRTLLVHLQKASGSVLEQMPRDLFFPREKAVQSARPVSLPDGSMGEFELTYVARCAPGHSWLRQAERRVITRIGDEERRASEIWTLAEA